MIQIQWTAASKAEASSIIKRLLEKHLIACASLFPVESHFIWEEKLESASEIKVLMKTQESHFSKVCTMIKTLCSYDIPEILSLPILDGNPDYLNWVEEATFLPPLEER